MPEPIILRNSLIIALLGVLQAAVPAILCTGLLLVSMHVAGVPLDTPYLALAAIIATVSLVLFLPMLDISSHLTSGRRTVVVSTLLRFAVLVGTLLTIGYFAKVSDIYSRKVIGLWIGLAPLLLIISALVLHELVYRMLADPRNTRRAVLAGCNSLSIELARRLETMHMRVEGFFDDRAVDRLQAAPDMKLLGPLGDLPAFAQQNSIDVVFVALPIRHIPRVMSLLDELRNTTVSIYYVPDIHVFDLIQARTTDVLGIPVVSMCETPFHGYRGLSKRAMDFVLALSGLIVLSPLLLTFAALIKLTSPGPVIFRQRRYGLDGRPITVYKFRSMTVTEDGSVIRQASRNDSRVTPIGRLMRRLSIDELPQLLNVVQGRMSLVGPRPHAVAHNEEYRKLIKGYMVRHKVLPGITGWAQVNGSRGEIESLEDLQKRVRYDLEYLRRWSLALDIRIILHTLMQMLGDKKAY